MRKSILNLPLMKYTCYQSVSVMMEGENPNSKQNVLALILKFVLAIDHVFEQELLDFFVGLVFDHAVM